MGSEGESPAVEPVPSLSVPGWGSEVWAGSWAEVSRDREGLPNADPSASATHDTALLAVLADLQRSGEDFRPSRHVGTGRDPLRRGLNARVAAVVTPWDDLLDALTGIADLATSGPEAKNT